MEADERDELVAWRAATPTRVAHVGREAYSIYIGRPGKGQTSIWGNPFRMHSEAERERCCQAHRSYLARQDHLLARLDDLKGEVLGCFCHPRRCHGDTLAELADMTPAERRQWVDAVLATE